MDQAPLSDFGLYFAQYHQSKKGFQLGAPPEAGELAEVSDYLLTLVDGFNVQILCVIDYDAHPNKQFDIPLETVFAIAEKCKAYTGRISRTKGFVYISLIELGYAPSPERRERLSRYKTTGIFSKARVMAFTVEEGSRTVWTNAPVQGGFQRRSFLSLLRKPRLAQNDLAPRQVVVRRPAFPVTTALIALLLAGMFFLELSYGIGPEDNAMTPGLRTLVGFGGLLRSAVWSGDWYRFFLAPVLHADVLHLCLNVFALFLAGRVFERLAGWAWFAATFVLSALGGAVGSLFWIGDKAVTVGASGGISGLLAAGLVSTFRFPNGPERTGLQVSLLMVLLPGLLPQISRGDLMHIDLGAHFGGAVTGALIGLFLLRNWSPAKPLPEFRKAAMGIVAIGIAGLAASSLAAREGYRQQMLALDLVPEDRMPDDDAAWVDQSETLVSQYPKDPRARFARAVKLLQTNDLSGAEQELREGLSQEEILRNFIKPEFTASGRAMLAVILYDQNKPEAQEVARPVCGRASEKLMQALNQRGLCS